MYLATQKQKGSQERPFDEDINDEDEVNPKTTVNVNIVQAMKKLQASYNDYANKIVKVAQEKSAK